MKNLFFGVCFIIVFVFAGCATGSGSTGYVFDPEIPEDQMSFLWIPNYVKVKQFSDTTVDWIAPPLSMTLLKVGVPSGEYTFIIDTVIVGSNMAGVPDIKDKSFTKNFEVGKGYQLISRDGDIILLDL